MLLGYSYISNAYYHWRKLLSAPSACKKRRAELFHALSAGMLHPSNQGQPWHWSRQTSFRIDDYDAFE
jgi:hypothetical protein